MSIEIKRIYLENYKLFTLKEIDFSDYLSVFDGPNGYGKTSIFDAVEFVITGSISRIQENEVVAANISYLGNCLANNSKKDIRIKAEFKDNETSESIVIAISIPASTGASKQNNPKSIETQTISYVLPEYDIPVEMWKEYLVSTEYITAKRKEFFGEQNINLFKMLHYIHQEDRLAYFKKSEGERSKTITDLLGIEKDVKNLTKLYEAQRQLGIKHKALKNEIRNIETEIESLSQSTEENVAYEALIGGIPIWDKEVLGFNGPRSKTLFEQIKGQIKDTSVFIENKQWYLISTAIHQFEKISISKRNAAIQGWFLKKSSENAIDDIRKHKETLTFLTEQKELLLNNDFINVEWKKLCELLDCEDSLETIYGYVNELRLAEQNQTNLGYLANSFYQAREIFAQSKRKLDSLNDGVCPYCGYKWDSDYKLQEQFESTKSILEQLLGGENTIFDQAILRCKKYYEEVCQSKIEARIAIINSNQGIQLLNVFKDFTDFKSSVENCNLILNYLVSSNYFNESDATQISRIDSIIAEIKETVPNTYAALSVEHGFDRIYKEYFSNNEYLESVTVEQMKNKEKYVEAQYYSSFDQTRQKLVILKEQEEKLSTLYNNIKIYYSALKKSIDAYQQLVIKQIEIPFFLYCSRLLQSYQGGQGVLIDSKDSKIRFTAPGGEHDVLYTMSSGQLSAVLLAFSLVLNKIYSGRKFKTMFIDDPIQCMDDINMISFVELLRREFAENQIILSTHEDTFANYIKYKFSKYNLRSQSITLKNDR